MQHSRELLAEFIGTFVLIFAGTGAVMVDKLSNGAVTHLGISIVFGAVVTALIYSLGHISGAHFNPAVTLAFWRSGFFRRNLVLPCVLAQVLGAIAASLLLRLSLGAVGNLGATMPRDGNWLQSLILETVYPQPKDTTKTTALKAAVEWALTTGKASANDLGYPPLDDALVAKAKAELNKVK
ncbi:MIP/aquaporin family protein [Chamaesiphon minutus]|uniref:Permease, glycerol uptake facilitator n=1 Tax=Chamaesiphon minutus (strain ATCC 27169 / PCC 6605) TaxID=1173020 RepID=K9UJX9_CHAP6|nr:aquaporin [Chamaesiphon minutus]AFY94963.1 permease, glycerol uptake facilitator [Chamaesiphon minutus PCC 6605]